MRWNRKKSKKNKGFTKEIEKNNREASTKKSGLFTAREVGWEKRRGGSREREAGGKEMM